MKFLYLFMGITALQSFQTVYGQDPSAYPIGNVSIASPHAASLGKYADYPVSYHTGIPQISIPFYTAKSGAIQVPVSLSYHASGLKVQEQASWVGAGWSLNAGGMITRSVIGCPDDKGLNSGVNQAQYGHWSNYGYSSYLTAGNGGNPNDNNFSTGVADGEPDMYFFNFGNYSGKFYFRDDRTPVLVPEEDYNIIPDSGYVSTPYTNGYCFRGFTVITSDGTRYYFGATRNSGATTPIEATSPYTLNYGFINGTAISSWFLNKIISKDGMDSVMFNYSQENYSYYTLSMFPLVSSNMIGKYEYIPIKEYLQGVRLNSIVFPEGQINFKAGAARLDLSSYSTQTMAESVNTDGKSLDTVQITNNGQLCKQFILYYGYFQDVTNGLNGQLNNWLGSANIQSDKYKLRLDSVKEASCDGSLTVPPYKFTYYSEPVARNLSFSIDHWGFNNGVTTNSTLIPTYSVNNSTVVTGANREAQWPAMRGGALQQITYPTGGYSQFNFEPHNIYGQVTNNWANATIFNLVYGIYGQSVGVKTQTFTINNPGALTIYMTSTSNYSCSLVIKDANNNTVYTTGLPNWDGFTGTNVNGTSTVTLNSGNYTAILSPTGTSNYSLVTGGVTAQMTQWQNNPYYTTLTVGGLRINNIVHYDPVAANTVSTNYSYINPVNNLSSGTLYSVPNYVCIIRNDGYGIAFGNNCPSVGANPNGCATLAGGGLQASFFVSPSSVRPLTAVKGNHIGYDFVKVTQTGNGYSTYEYYDDYINSTPWVPTLASGDVAIRNVNNNTCSNIYPSYPFAPIPFNFMTGELKHQAHYNQSGQLLKEAWSYPVYTKDLTGTPGYRVQVTQVGATSSFIFGTEYMLYSAAKTQDQTVETEYDPANNTQLTTTNITNYSSLFHHEPTQKIMTNSTGDQVQTKIKYTFDYRIASADALTDPLDAYNTAITTAKNNLNSNLNSTSCINYQPCSTNACTYTSFTNFRVTEAQARNNWMQSKLSNKAQFISIHNNAKASADAELKPLLELQDEFDNAAIETSKWKRGNLLSSSFTRYDYVTNPASIVYPQKTQTINLIIPSSTFTASSTSASGTSVTKDSRYIDESIYHFNGGRIVDVTPKSNVTTAYIWGYANQLPVAKITGSSYASAIGLVDQSTINSLTSPDGTVRSTLNSLRTGLPNALVKTYTYAPVVGMTSETDQRTRNTLYQYDKLGRLVIIRDNDSNIVKKICYNYAGQPVACAMGCVNTSANWQNTSATPTCQTGTCGYTGYQWQQQQDMNPCSPSFSQLQTVLVYNPSACTPATGVPITATNNTGVSGFVVTYTNSASQVFTFNMPASGTSVLGCVPAGIYTVRIVLTGNTTSYLFDVGCANITGTGALFKSRNVSSSTCNVVNISSSLQ